MAIGLAALASLGLTSWFWLFSGRAGFHNTVYYVAPAAFALSWASLGVLITSAVMSMAVRNNPVRIHIILLVALLAGVFGVLQVYLRSIPTPSDEAVFLFSPVIAIEVIVCYGLLWLGIRQRHRQEAGGDHSSRGVA